MNFKQYESLSQKKSNKSLQLRGDRIKVINPQSIPNTPTSSKYSPHVASKVRIQTMNSQEKHEKMLDLQNKRINRIQQVSLDSEPKVFVRKSSQLTIQSDSDLLNLIEVKTTRTTQREFKLEERIIKKEIIGDQQKVKKFQACESQTNNNNNNILDLLLLNTQQLKDIFEKVKQPQIRQKPKINNIKRFPSDFFSIQ